MQQDHLLFPYQLHLLPLSSPNCLCPHMVTFQPLQILSTPWMSRSFQTSRPLLWLLLLPGRALSCIPETPLPDSAQDHLFYEALPDPLGLFVLQCMLYRFSENATTLISCHYTNLFTLWSTWKVPPPTCAMHNMYCLYMEILMPVYLSLEVHVPHQNPSIWRTVNISDSSLFPQKPVQAWHRTGVSEWMHGTEWENKWVTAIVQLLLLRFHCPPSYLLAWYQQAHFPDLSAMGLY